jgi:hypothetical protein
MRMEPDHQSSPERPQTAAGELADRLRLFYPGMTAEGDRIAVPIARVDGVLSMQVELRRPYPFILTCDEPIVWKAYRTVGADFANLIFDTHHLHADHDSECLMSGPTLHKASLPAAFRKFLDGVTALLWCAEQAEAEGLFQPIVRQRSGLRLSDEQQRQVGHAVEAISRQGQDVLHYLTGGSGLNANALTQDVVAHIHRLAQEFAMGVLPSHCELAQARANAALEDCVQDALKVYALNEMHSHKLTILEGIRSFLRLFLGSAPAAIAVGTYRETLRGRS